MKVYRSKNDQPKKKMNKRTLASVCVSLALLAAAVAITLSLTLGGKSPAIEPNPPPANVQPVYVMPIEDFEVGKVFADDKLVKYTTSGWYETHEGVDFIVPTGSKIQAIFDGTILSVDANTTMEGSVVKIQHPEGVVSVYKGLGAVSVEVGDTVKAGDEIGVVGIMTIEAREYDQPHLHLEVFKNNARINPIDVLPEIGDK